MRGVVGVFAPDLLAGLGVGAAIILTFIDPRLGGLGELVENLELTVDYERGDIALDAAIDRTGDDFSVGCLCQGYESLMVGQIDVGVGVELVCAVVAEYPLDGIVAARDFGRRVGYERISGDGLAVGCHRDGDVRVERCRMQGQGIPLAVLVVCAGRVSVGILDHSDDDRPVVGHVVCLSADDELCRGDVGRGV